MKPISTFWDYSTAQRWFPVVLSSFLKFARSLICLDPCVMYRGTYPITSGLYRSNVEEQGKLPRISIIWRLAVMELEDM